ncbi:MAG TPA: hypothetical protein VFD41_03545 [Actinomycetales bacterium]|nr:hypothetical protein [Actinomycetales bacterium]
MSLTAPIAPQPGRARRPHVPTPRLRVVAPPRSTRRRLPFAAACAGILALCLVGLLLLNIALTRGAYDVDSLRREAALLSEREQALTERLAAEASPQALSARAIALGMVPSTNPAFIRLADGAILGVPQPAEAPPTPIVTTPLAPTAPPVTTVTD